MKDRALRKPARSCSRCGQTFRPTLKRRMLCANCFERAGRASWFDASGKLPSGGKFEATRHDLTSQRWEAKVHRPCQSWHKHKPGHAEG